MNRILILVQSQIAVLEEKDRKIREYPISTAKNGLGCEIDSFCTPYGKFEIDEKIGTGHPIGTIFRSRIPTGECWSKENNLYPNEDLILSRILWLEGLEAHNQNTKERYIYLHGTNHEDQIGKPESHGCIRFRNRDILELYNFVEVGTEVWIPLPV